MHNFTEMNKLNPREVSAHEAVQNRMLFDTLHKIECGIDVMVTWKTGETRYGKLLLSPDQRVFVDVKFQPNTSFYIEMCADGSPYPTEARAYSLARNDPSFVIEGWRYLTDKEEDDRPIDTYQRLRDRTYLGSYNVLSSTQTDH